MAMFDKLVQILSPRAASISTADAAGESSPRDGVALRRYGRFRSEERATIYWSDGLGLRREARVEVLDVSVGGMALIAEQAFERGSCLSIRTDSQSFEAVVRNATKVEEGFRVGVEAIPFPLGGDTQKSLRQLAQALQGYGSAAPTETENGGVCE